MAEEEQGVFDPVAAGYDQEFSDTEIGKLQRAQVRGALMRYVGGKAELSVLELNCGTGEDAIWLGGELGHQVLATDASGGMISVVDRKLAGRGVKGEIETKKLTFAEVGVELEGRQFDFVLSNFGGLNCIDANGLRSLAEDLAGLVPTGGKIAVVLMSPWCWWEWVYFGLKLRWKRAVARLGKGSVQVPLGGGVFQETWYFSPKRVEKAFSGAFRKVEQRPIGLWVPPGYLEPFFRKRMKWLDRLGRWDQKWGNRPLLAGFGDHFLVVFERVPG